MADQVSLDFGLLQKKNIYMLFVFARIVNDLDFRYKENK